MRIDLIDGIQGHLYDDTVYGRVIVELVQYIKKLVLGCRVRQFDMSRIYPNLAGGLNFHPYVDIGILPAAHLHDRQARRELRQFCLEITDLSAQIFAYFSVYTWKNFIQYF